MKTRIETRSRPTWTRRKVLGKFIQLTGLAAPALSWPWVSGCRSGGNPRDAGGPTPARSRELEIDLDGAIPIVLPEIREDLGAVRFRAPDGKEGWVVRIPSERPIATPAYAGGMLFVGGGYGSHEFYAFDAGTGEVVWQMKTADDGPTAAVVEDDCVAFNTESCTVVVVEARTGKVLWQEWLGDPLMSQPAIYRGKLYIAYPAGQRGGGAQAQTVQSAPGNQATSLSAARPGHRLLCADLRSGRHIWEREITADVISAPVIEGEQVFLTCFDGVSFCLDASSGAVVWRKESSGTSAPLVVGDQVIITRKEQSRGGAVEGIQRLDVEKGQERGGDLLAAGAAGYLEKGKGGGVGFSTQAAAALDSSVGFGGGAPAGAQLDKANSHLGINTVAGGWAYQGARAAYCRGQILNAQGRFFNCVQGSDGNLAWRCAARGKGIGDDTQVFSPPALGRRDIYLASALGHLLAVRQEDGAVRFLYSTGQPMPFQPALADGSIYAGTVNGLLLRLDTGDADADGWYAWGGNAQHNKKQ